MPINRLIVKDFTVFADAEFEFSPGVNVLIGANGTGKTHVLKVLYALIKSWEKFSPSDNGNAKDDVSLGFRIRDKLIAVFRPDKDKLWRLLRRPDGSKQADLSVDLGKTNKKSQNIEFSFKRTDIGPEHSFSCVTKAKAVPDCVFLPSEEVLSFSQDLVGVYDKRELRLDETYFDLAKALLTPPLKGQKPSQSLSGSFSEINKLVGGKVVRKDTGFFVKTKSLGLIEASLLAEGFRKLATITRLIENGTIAKGTLLFWDEPESNLNPHVITIVARLLLKLAAAGVQVFVATHDYLLTNELSLQAEYETEESRKAKPQFFCLHREKVTDPVEVQTGHTLAELEDNPILAEFAAHYERERSLFYSE